MTVFIHFWISTIPEIAGSSGFARKCMWACTESFSFIFLNGSWLVKNMNINPPKNPREITNYTVLLDGGIWGQPWTYYHMVQVEQLLPTL